MRIDILSLFDGGIRVNEKGTPQGAKQALRIRRLYNQKFLGDEPSARSLVPVYPEDVMKKAGATYKYPPWQGPWTE